MSREYACFREYPCANEKEWNLDENDNNNRLDWTVWSRAGVCVCDSVMGKMVRKRVKETKRKKKGKRSREMAVRSLFFSFFFFFFLSFFEGSSTCARACNPPRSRRWSTCFGDYERVGSCFGGTNLRSDCRARLRRKLHAVIFSLDSSSLSLFFL